MDKNVGSVDLDELMKARQELNQEKGIETDPNMYSDYNPNREEVKSPLFDGGLEDTLNLNSETESNEDLSENVLNHGEEELKNVENPFENADSEQLQKSDEPEIVPDEITKGEKDMSLYDMFSAFEVNDGNSNSTESESANNNIQDTEEVLKSDEDLKDDKDSKDDEEESAIDILNSVLPDLGNTFVNEDETEEKTDINQNNETSLNEAPASTQVLNDEDKEENVENSTANDNNEEMKVSNTSSVSAVEETKKTENQGNNESKIEDSQAEIITDFSKLQDIFKEELKSADDESESKLENVEIVERHEKKLPEIPDFKFVEEISDSNFKAMEKQFFLIGRNEDGNSVYGSFETNYNYGIFCENEDFSNNLINSILLSLCLKNDVKDINFVICDANMNSSFEKYNNSSYMFFNRVAKTKKEILDTLIEVTKEIDDRYEKLATLSMKNIEMYNDVIKNSGITKLPHIVVIMNNYIRAIEASDPDKINSCLSKILKYGRIVGVNAVVVSRDAIVENDINYNLPSRIAFKSNRDSVYTLGKTGTKNLVSDMEALYSTILMEDFVHIKVPYINETEVELLIKNLEE